MQGPQRLVIAHGHVKQQLQVLARVLDFNSIKTRNRPIQLANHVKMVEVVNFNSGMVYGTDNGDFELFKRVNELKLGIMKLQLQSTLTRVCLYLQEKENNS